jgi:transcriptional regulator with XRE-family HTH domain
MKAQRRVRWQIDAERIDRARILSGLSQRQLAQLARVDPDTLGDLLGRRRQATLGTVLAVCRQLQLGLEDVIAFADGGAKPAEHSRIGLKQNRLPR